MAVSAGKRAANGTNATKCSVRLQPLVLCALILPPANRRTGKRRYAFRLYCRVGFHFLLNRGPQERSRVDLAMRMRHGDSHRFAAILKHVHQRNLRVCGMFRRPARPYIDHLAPVLHAQLRWRQSVFGRIKHHVAGAARTVHSKQTGVIDGPERVRVRSEARENHLGKGVRRNAREPCRNRDRTGHQLAGICGRF